jgi:competence protein ComEC
MAGSTAAVSPVPPRRPFVPLALGLCSGVLLQNQFPSAPEAWLCACLLAVIGAGAALCVWRDAAGFCLLVAAATLGGLRSAHDRRIEADDVARVAAEGRKLVRLFGVVDAPPLFEKAPLPSPMRPVVEDRTRLHIAVEGLRDGSGQRRSASGRVVAALPGGPPNVRRGDRVQLLGWLAVPNAPSSPGEWDYRAWLARRRVTATLYAESAAGLQVVERAAGRSPTAWIDDVAHACRSKLARLLPSGTLGVAEAAVLGARDGLRRDELDPFVHSGTLHLLVVSGWHIAVVAWAAWSLGGLLRSPLALRSSTALAAVWGYTLLTGAEAPALRAAAVASTMLVGKLLLRRADPLNSLAAAFALVTVVDPWQAFSPGTQLSFAAVLGLVLFGGAGEYDGDPDEARWAARRRLLAQTLRASVAAWATTAPLVAWHYHLLSPGSIWLSVILAPVLAAAIGACAIALVLPDAAAWPFAWFAHWCLSFVQWSVETTDRGFGAFAFLPGPTGWWTAGAYLLLFGPFCIRSIRPLGRLQAFGVSCWSALGLLTWSIPASPTEPEFHQLAVGHGNCAAARLGDRTVLIDAGSLTNPYAGERLIAPWLWANGVGRLDAVLVSHADADHFNAVPALADRFPIDAVYLTPAFFRWPQSAAKALVAELQARGIPIRFLWEGDRFVEAGATIAVRWPPANLRPSSDNAASAVFEIAAQGRTVLGTGDLEKEGLARLLASGARGPDVFVLPHHGGKSSNPAELADSAQPLAALCSQHERSGDTLFHYRQAGAVGFRTDVDGTIAVRWRSGELVVESFATRRRLRLPADGFPNASAPAIFSER